MNLACLFFGHRWQAQRCQRCDAWRTMPPKVKEVDTCHQLKVWPEYFNAIIHGGKRFEVRRSDRNFKVGDKLFLDVWDPLMQMYTGSGCICTITYILPGGQHGIAEGYAVLGFELHTIMQPPFMSPYAHVLSHH